MQLSPHTAQARVNAPWRHAVTPIGLGVPLDVTTAGPATELPAVAGAAPARIFAIPPTCLRRPLRRFTDGSRSPAPEGSLRPCGRGDVARWLNPYPADYWPAFACSLLLYPLPRRLALRLPYPERRGTGLPRSAGGTHGWLRSRLSAGGTPSAPGEFGAPGPDHVPFGPSLISQPPRGGHDDRRSATASLACSL